MVVNRHVLLLVIFWMGMGGVRANAAELKSLPVAVARDVKIDDHLFATGIPVASGSFSPDGNHFAYIHAIPGGLLDRKPARSLYLLDLKTGKSQAVPAPHGKAARLGGWDPTGRYILIETHHRNIFSPLTGTWWTYHFLYDVITSEFVTRKPFTGHRGNRLFRWKRRGSYHGGWTVQNDEALVWPLEDGELTNTYRATERTLAAEDRRRFSSAARIALRSGDGPPRSLDEVLNRLDHHWREREQRDPITSELFGPRPALVAKSDAVELSAEQGLTGPVEEWMEISAEIEHVAVLDHDLILFTRPDGSQAVLDLRRFELLPLPPPPEGWADVLRERWGRAGDFYNEADPLPRDAQYRRTYQLASGTGLYFHYVTVKRTQILAIYSFAAERRVLRVIDLPPTWRQDPDA